MSVASLQESGDVAYLLVIGISSFTLNIKIEVIHTIQTKLWAIGHVNGIVNVLSADEGFAPAQLQRLPVYSRRWRRHSRQNGTARMARPGLPVRSCLAEIGCPMVSMVSIARRP